jgi:hypothetical protein
LDRSVAAGESRRTVRQLGFSLADPFDASYDPEPSDSVRFLDWDEVAGRRYAQLAVH